MLCVSYSLAQHTWGSLDEKIDTVVGTPHTGSGTGGAVRDLDYWFDSSVEMLLAYERVSKLRVRGVESSHTKLCPACNGRGCLTCRGTGKA